MLNTKFKKIAILLIVVVGILIKLPFITNPISDWHSWNQITTMASARYMVEGGINSFFNAQVDLFENFEKDSNRTYAELPILSGLIAIGFKVTNSENEWIARLICILISVLGSIYFYKLVYETVNEKVAYYAITLYLLSPMNWYFHRTVMTDVIMVSFVIAGLYHFYYWVKDQKKSSFIYASLFTTIAALSKPYALYIGIAYLFLLLEYYEWKKLFRFSNVLFAILTVSPVFAWIWFCNRQIAAGSGGHNLMESAGLLGSFSIWFDKVYWSTLFSSVSDFTLMSIGFIVFLYTFIRHFRKLKDNKITLYWLAAVMFYFLFVRQGNKEHDYYQMPFAAPVIFITAIGLNEWFRWLKSKLSNRGYLIVFAVFWGLLIIIGSKYTFVKASLDMSPVELGKKLNKLNRGSGYVLVVDPDYLQRNQAVYYSRSKGWHIRKLPDLGLISEYKKHGVKYFGINYKTKSLAGDADLFKAYNSNLRKVWQGTSTNRYQQPKTLFIYEL